jgi:hypothetical protein
MDDDLTISDFLRRDQDVAATGDEAKVFPPNLGAEEGRAEGEDRAEEDRADEDHAGARGGNADGTAAEGEPKTIAADIAIAAVVILAEDTAIIIAIAIAIAAAITVISSAAAAQTGRAETSRAAAQGNRGNQMNESRARAMPNTSSTNIAVFYWFGQASASARFRNGGAKF